MIDIRLVREKFEAVKQNLAKRGKPEHLTLLDELTKKDKAFRDIKPQADSLRQRRNQISEEINQAKKTKKPADSLLKEAKEIPQKLKALEEQEALLQNEIKDLLYKIPNLLLENVPEGKDAKDNPVIRTWGKIPKFNFPLKSHTELIESLNIGDFDAARETTGQGFNYLLNELAILDNALQRYGVDFLLERGFSSVIPPLMLNKETLGGAVDLSAFQEVIYKIDQEDLYLIGTAEHALVSMMKNKIIPEKQLPLKFCAVTPCFRKEIGSHGVDTKGLFRMHQFNKVEQVVYALPERSLEILEEMQKITEEFLQSLKISYQVVEICTGDLGPKFAKQYDIEAWFPRQNAYKEVTSAGNCTDYQARRLNIKFEKKGERFYPHILNNTMVATSRAMVAILENFQQKDGSIKIPEVLQKYTGFKVIKPKSKS